MKNLNRLLFLSMIMPCLSPLAQTKEIAWKSHSGKMVHFNPKQDGDLGLFIPPLTLVCVEKVNETTFIQTFNNNFMEPQISIDTIYYDSFWMKSKAELDSLVPLYYPGVILVGFDENPSDSKPILKKTTNQTPL